MQRKLKSGWDMQVAPLLHGSKSQGLTSRNGISTNIEIWFEQ